jgi:hypothetical protein
VECQLTGNGTGQHALAILFETAVVVNLTLGVVWNQNG